MCLVTHSGADGDIVGVTISVLFVASHCSEAWSKETSVFRHWSMSI